ncbi:DUF4915 domain-containing protein [Paraburkholderia sp. D1E]|uniref:DUF4915 domain-containing protein n=1 Tax=Paraburkholderia sp. D1E TaxID=3461398 RepID=UPI004046223D
MTPLLLSFCYAKPVGHALALFDCDTNAFEWIDLSDVPLPVYGATGVCRVGDVYYAALQVRAPGTLGTLLAQFDGAGRLQRTAALAQVQDAHSLLWWNGELLLVSSGTNQVFAIDWAPDSEPRTRVFFERDPGADTLHMNSLQAFDGRVYLSMFGCKPSASGQEAADGQVLDLNAGGAVVRRGLQHPHSLFVDGMSLCCVNSRTSTLIHVAGPTPPREISLHGYVRGARVEGERLFVGTSMLRTGSKSRGTTEVVDNASAVRNGGGCGLQEVEMASGVQRWHDLSAFGAELYDVLPWAGRAVEGTRGEAMVRRLHAVNSEFNSVMNALYRLRQQYASIERMLHETIDTGQDIGPAQRLLERLYADQPDLPEWNLLKGRLLLASGAEPLAALSYFSKAIEANYRCFDAHCQMSRAYALADDAFSAAQHAQSALKLAPATTGAHVLAQLARAAVPAPVLIR